MSDHDSNGSERRYVTNAELEKKLERLPTRWEMRFLILSGLAAAQLLPVRDVAQAAIQIIK